MDIVSITCLLVQKFISTMNNISLLHCICSTLFVDHDFNFIIKMVKRKCKKNENTKKS